MRYVSHLQNAASWVPIVVLILHATVAIHSRIEIGHWPVQSVDLEIDHLPSSLLRGHALIGEVGTVLLLLSIPVWIVSGLVLLRAPERREPGSRAVLFGGTIAFWLLSVAVVPTIGRFYGWWFD